MKNCSGPICVRWLASAACFAAINADTSTIVVTLIVVYAERRLDTFCLRVCIGSRERRLDAGGAQPLDEAAHG